MLNLPRTSVTSSVKEENKGENVANYMKKRRIFANVKGKVVEPQHSK